MEALPLFHIKILQILAGRNTMSCTLENLTNLLTTLINDTVIPDDMSIENEKQSRVLDALLILNDQGYIFLNSNTDRSVITIKGLIKIDNKAFCN